MFSVVPVMTPQNKYAVEIMHFDLDMNPLQIVRDFLGLGIEVNIKVVEKIILEATQVNNYYAETAKVVSYPNMKIITYGGETRTLSDWARLVGMPSITLRMRLYHGWSVKDALTTPKRKHKKRARPTKQSQPALRQSPGPQARADT